MAQPRIGTVLVLTRSCDHSNLLVVCFRISNPFPQDQLASLALNRDALGWDFGLPCFHV